MVQNFREIAENPMNENFRDKKFRDRYFFFVISAAARRLCGQLIHVVAPPTIARD